MKYAESLKKNYEFRVVYRRGKSFANKYLVVYKLKNNKSNNRLGISVSKKVGNSVVRSRTTRLIRESYRLNEEYIEKQGWDFVIVARSNANGASYQDISSALIHLLKQHRVYDIQEDL
nr:ribonuclease P protein component [uncultured Cellulosilyticum sp.]